MPVADVRRISLLVYAKFLLGDRRAIETILQARGVLPLAVLLTISAGLAREYDGEYLLAEPWYVLIPLGVASGMATVLWLLLLVTSWRFLPKSLALEQDYVKFLTCYLLTAPLAWLYAIPVERLFDELEATRCNLATLSVVSVWRVLLITRIAAVLFRRSYVAVLSPVLLFASSAVIIGSLANFRLAEVMAGVRMTAVESLIRTVTGYWFGSSLYSWPVSALGTIIAATLRPEDRPTIASEPTTAKPGVSWVIAAGLSVLIWIPILPGPQREQHLRYVTEQLFARDDIPAGLALLSSHPQSDFPPHWKPPPVGYREFANLSLTDVIVHFSAERPPPWVRRPYFDKITRILRAYHGEFLITDSDWPRLVEALVRLPEGATVVCDSYEVLKFSATRDQTGCIAKLLDLARESGCPQASMNSGADDGP